ncbi:AraC family transcriptional regulator [Chitinispirillales bacterium ANBcel5]|uniref:helix-turn-helix domain-containing protein n=1 Tax=Cellulosispirillum alkaliphilum TaxID=3039283 RepID=UPI002A4EE1BA|nr:AraC family transcriptional regulator [Chitinispirillales bacterium ANBcel5]
MNLKILPTKHLTPKKLLFLSPILIAGLIFLNSLRNKTYTILPNEQYQGFVYDDRADQGNSIIYGISDSSGMNLEFRLQQGFNHPYVGVIFHLNEDSDYTDISMYDFLSVKIRADEPPDLAFHLRSFVEGFTNPDDHMSYRFLVREVMSSNSQHTFRLPLSSFSTPQWWYSLYRREPNEFPKEKFSCIASLVIQSGTSTPVDKNLSMNIESIRFEKNLASRAISFLLFLIIYGVGGFVIYSVFVRKKKKTPQKLIVTYEPLKVQSYTDEETKRIVSFIARSFNNPNLDAVNIAREVGISPNKISSVLRKSMSCSLKQYLNSIRITEAKRLLRSTDRQIAEISRKVGYNNVAHFNRMFKITEGVTPNQYRKKSHT